MQMAATEFSDTSDGTPTTLRIYLAGPDVFLPQPRQWAEWKKAVCARHGLIGISPLDDAPDHTAGPGALPEWQRIALRNEALIRSADAMIANLTPFRGPSADVGTAYEVGFIRALGRPVFGYSTTAMPFTQRSRDFAMGHGGALAGRDRSLRDADGMLIEQFGLKSPTDASNTLLSAKRIFKAHLNQVIKEYAGQDAATATEIQALEDFLGRLAKRG